MKSWKVVSVLLIGLFLAFALAATTTTGGARVLSLDAVVKDKSYTIKPAHPIPTEPGETFTLTITGTTVDAAGKVTKDVAIDTTFAVQAGDARVDLSDPTANGVTVTVHHRGRHGNQLKYTATPPTGYSMPAGLAKGFINLD
jgi:hypothetical protein